MTSMAGYSSDLVMPYKPVPAPGFCQLCWKRSNVLARVTVEPSGWRTVNGKRSRTCARVVLVCNRHPGEIAQGAPLTTPNERMLPGTTKLRPQPLCLFDDLSLKVGGRR